MVGAAAFKACAVAGLAGRWTHAHTPACRVGPRACHVPSHLLSAAPSVSQHTCLVWFKSCLTQAIIYGTKMLLNRGRQHNELTKNGGYCFLRKKCVMNEKMKSNNNIWIVRRRPTLPGRFRRHLSAPSPSSSSPPNRLTGR
jgi:hypothetical protein